MEIDTLVFGIAVSSGLLAGAALLQLAEVLTRRQRHLRKRLRLVADGGGLHGVTADVSGLRTGGVATAGGSDAENPVFARQRKRVPLPFIPVLGRVVGRKYMERIRVNLTKAGLPLRPEELASMGLVLAATGAISGWAVGKGPFLSAGLALAGLFIPGVWVNRAKRRRAQRLEGQLVDALTLIANSLRAGHSFMQALELVARDMVGPLAPELGRVSREVRLGLSVDEAFAGLLSRFDSGDLDLVVTGVLIQRQVGGNLAVVLDSIASTVDKRLRARAKVRSLTAQGRLSAWIITLLPFALAGLVFGFYPDFGRIMLVSPVGIGMLGGAAVLLVLGVFAIRRVVNVDVS